MVLKVGVRLRVRRELPCLRRAQVRGGNCMSGSASMSAAATVARLMRELGSHRVFRGQADPHDSQLRRPRLARSTRSIDGATLRPNESAMGLANTDRTLCHLKG